MPPRKVEVLDIASTDDLHRHLSKPSRDVVVNFWASWAEPCVHMNEVFSALADLHAPAPVDFLRAEAERFPDLLDRYNIAAVPTFVLFRRGDGEELKRVEGADAATLTEAVSELASGKLREPEKLEDRLRKLTLLYPVMLFMKGSPDIPRCGFSRQIVDILRKQGIEFGSFDILEDQDVRAGLKALSQWPTYPQLYCSGEFIGGLDIVKQLVESGALKDEIAKAKRSVPAPAPESVPSAPATQRAAERNIDYLETRLKSLISSHKVMLFMKGQPNEPRCGFSAQIVSILRAAGVEFGTFDILSDVEVRQGLKDYSNWPTYPQLYVKGELFGGLDIVKELSTSGELKKELTV